MRRTSIYLDDDTDARLKREARRRGASMADLVREAVRSYLPDEPRQPPGKGAFKSGHSKTAERAEDVLDELGFGEDD